MILDTSAIVAIFLEERGCEELHQTVRGDPNLSIGTPTLVEAAMVLAGRLKNDSRPRLQAFLKDYAVTVVAFTEEHYAAATTAFHRYGKGRHPAALNFGDCCSYAVAKVAGEPLLYTGNDFAKTDLRRS